MKRQQKDWTVRGVLVLMSLICAPLGMPVFAVPAAVGSTAKAGEAG